MELGGRFPKPRSTIDSRLSQAEWAVATGDSLGSTRQACRAAIAFHRRSGQTVGPMIHGERKRQPLLTTAIKLDAPDRLAVALDPEVRDQFDRPEPVAEITRPGLDLADDNQRAVATNPFVGPAPEREPARVVGVVAQNRVIAPQRVGEMGTCPFIDSILGGTSTSAWAPE
jgi:hypothetical protein